MKNKKIFAWGVAVVIFTIILGVVYVAVQQDLRQSANDPQIQVAEDTARLLEQGVPPLAMVSPDLPVDVTVSLATFVNIYDATGTIVVASGDNHGQPLSLPAGVLKYVQSHYEDSFTWQPQKGVRLATVAVAYTGASSSGAVVVARSLRDVESRESGLGILVGAGWLIGMIIITLAAFLWKSLMK